MKRRAILIAGIVALSGCLEGDVDDTQGSSGPEQEDDSNGTEESDKSNGTNQDDESNGTTENGESSKTDQDEADGTDQDDDYDTSNPVEITYTCPEEVERTFFDYEHLVINNKGTDTVGVTGFTVDYGDGTEYTIPELELMEGSSLVIMSWEGDDARLDRYPPIYLFYAGFGGRKETSVMDGSGVVALRDRDGNVIDEYEYDDADDQLCST